MTFNQNYLDFWYRKSSSDWLENERHRIDTETARVFDGYPWNFGCPNPEPPRLPVLVEPQATRQEAHARQKPSGPPEAVIVDPGPIYEQWIGLLYACAVFRGVLTHPPPKP